MSMYWKIQLIWLFCSSMVVYLIVDFKAAIGWAVGGGFGAVLCWVYNKCMV